MSRATKVTKSARRVRLSAFRHQSESHSLSAMPCSCSRNEPTANRHRKGTYAVLIIGTSADEESFLRKLSAYSSPCGYQNGADKTITSVLFQKTHSSAPEQRENLSLQISPTPSFGRDPDRTDTAVSTIVTEWDLLKLLLLHNVGGQFFPCERRSTKSGTLILTQPTLISLQSQIGRFSEATMRSRRRSSES